MYFPSCTMELIQVLHLLLCIFSSRSCTSSSVFLIVAILQDGTHPGLPPLFVAEEEEVQDLDEFGALLLCTSMLQP
jgi:hypothetical protein